MFRILRMIHLTVGIIGALIILMMSINGILLNHQWLIGFFLTLAIKFGSLLSSLFGGHYKEIQSPSTAKLHLQEFLFGLHSGSIGNTSIVWITDIGAICMIVLSVTGVWMWVKVILRKSIYQRGRREK